MWSTWAKSSQRIASGLLGAHHEVLEEKLAAATEQLRQGHPSPSGPSKT